MTDRRFNPHRYRGSLKRRQIFKGRFPTGDVRGRSTDTEWYHGDTVCIVIEVFDQDDCIVDLTDTEIKFTLRADEYCINNLLEYSTEQGQQIEVLDAERGLVKITIPAVDSETLDSEDYIFDVQLTFDDGFVGTVIRDWISFVRDITP